MLKHFIGPDLHEIFTFLKVLSAVKSTSPLDELFFWIMSVDMRQNSLMQYTFIEGLSHPIHGTDNVMVSKKNQKVKVRFITYEFSFLN